MSIGSQEQCTNTEIAMTNSQKLKIAIIRNSSDSQQQTSEISIRQCLELRWMRNSFLLEKSVEMQKLMKMLLARQMQEEKWYS
jgi:hypothetical protein